MSTVERTDRGLRLGGRSEPTLVSVVIPCLNEAETIQECIHNARKAMDDAGLPGEVLVADNGSDDGSPRWRRTRAPG